MKKLSKKRKRRLKRILATFFVIFINLNLIQSIFTVAHELVHQRIFYHYGVESKIICYPSKYLCLAGMTIANKTQLENLSEEDLRELRILHLFNEIYGYPINGLLIAITIITTLQGLIIVDFLKRKFKKN